MNHRCKLCQGPVVQRHVIKNIPYYHCTDCNFLQNFHWGTETNITPELTQVNDEVRAAKWPAGELDQMRQKGWEMLEFMYWPLAWKLRSAHLKLNRISLYRNIVREHIKRRGEAILDYGCGHGVIVEALRQENMNVEGLDPYSPVDAPWLIRDSLSEAHIPPKKYTGIFSVETFEHIPDIVGDVRKLYEILPPGGVLMVQTRRLEDPNYISQGEKWFYLEDPEAHVQVFSEQAMRVLARLTGFQSVTFRGVTLARFVK